MLTMDLKELGKNLGLAVEYLRPRLDERVKVKGSQVSLSHTSPRAAKLVLRKFQRQLRLEGYRVLVVHLGLIEVCAPQNEKKRSPRAAEVAVPSAWETVPDQWYLTPSGNSPPRQTMQETEKVGGKRTLVGDRESAGCYDTLLWADDIP
jgi:hypothetical protein